VAGKRQPRKRQRKRRVERRKHTAKRRPERSRLSDLCCAPGRSCEFLKTVNETNRFKHSQVQRGVQPKITEVQMIMKIIIIKLKVCYVAAKTQF